MSLLIKEIDFSVDIAELQRDCSLILSNYTFNEHNQICFQNTSPDKADVYEGTGDARLSHCPMYGLKEQDFKYFNAEFDKTVFRKIFDTFPYKIGRMRLTKLPPKKCYWMHNDPGMIRFHFAIFTNDNCFILYKNYSHYHIPANGICYKMETEKYHTAINASNEDRIHLLITGL